MTEAEKQGTKNPTLKWVFMACYGLVLACYGVVGGLLMGMVFPDFPIALWIVAAIFVGAKLDYKFGGLASRFEQKYVSHMEK